MITTVMFDMGGTLEDLYSDETTQRAMAEKEFSLLKEYSIPYAGSVSDLLHCINTNMQRYKDESVITRIEKKPEEIWRDYLLKDVVDTSLLTEDICERLAHTWETTYFIRKLRPHVIPMLSNLKDAGLRLGIISNTASIFQVFDTLEVYGIRDYFEQIVLSSIIGYRKPHVNAFRIAMRQMGVLPNECVYVGDTLARDVSGALAAGFQKTIQIHSFLTDSRDAGLKGKWVPDYFIKDMSEIPAIVAALR